MKKVWVWFKTNWNAALDSILWGGAAAGLFMLGWAALIHLVKKDYCDSEWFALGCLVAVALAFSYEIYKFIKKPQASLIVYSNNLRVNQINKDMDTAMAMFEAECRKPGDEKQTQEK